MIRSSNSIELTTEVDRAKTETVNQGSRTRDSDTEWLGDVKKGGEWCAEIKQLLREYDDRLKVFWKEEAENI